MKLIIKTNKVKIEDAIRLVGDVISRGKISQDKSGKQYCWVTSFCHSGDKKKIVVANRGRRKGSETESFYVFLDSK